MDNPDYIDTIKDGDLLPGQTVSTDQYECRVKGRLPNTRGREDPHKMYCGRTLFNDHASSKINVYQQVSLGASDTIRSKELYEQKAEEVGVKVLTYRGYNGVYTSKAFLLATSHPNSMSYTTPSSRRYLVDMKTTRL